MSVAVRLCCEEKRAVRAFERFLAGMSQDVAPKGRRPWKFPMAVWTGYSVRRKAVSRLLFRWLHSSIRLRSVKKHFFISKRPVQFLSIYGRFKMLFIYIYSLIFIASRIVPLTSRSYKSFFIFFLIASSWYNWNVCLIRYQNRVSPCFSFLCGDWGGFVD